MEAERWSRMEALFHRALELGAEGRAEMLARECAGDAELRARIERMLRDDARNGDVFDAVEEHARAAPPDPMLGRTVGTYRLVERLALGGMGVVYRGERTDGLFAQQVAVKLIRSERVTEGMLRRFERERRTLAALDHPSIARLHDGGTAEDGRPYLVMELVRGVPIDRHCDTARLSIAERVRLFVQVCHAVHFAHQSLVVHRDLKPANILIDERGAPKLLDFGIARLLEGDGERTPEAATLTLERILTPEYASPEQIAGGPVTTAIDVYSLGVILYEILTGQKPFRRDGRSLAEWESVVRAQVPPRPSTVVSHPAATAGEHGTLEFARRLGSTPHVLGRRLRGDLDRIVLMALRKEPERRYSSARELADDLGRYLAGQPVLARGDSVGYRAAKFVRRNRIAVTAAAAVATVLIAALVATQRSERRTQAMADRARVQANSFEAIAEFLEETFLTAAVARDDTRLHLARESVLLQAERVRRQYPDQDPIRANLLDALGQVCVRLDAFEDAEHLMREALALREHAFGSQSVERAQSLRSLGQLDYRLGAFARAAETLRQAHELQRACAPEAHADAAALANDLAACLRHTGRDDEAEQLHLDALALRRALGDGSLPVAESLNNLAAIHLDRGEIEPAARELEEALEIRGSILGERHPLTLQTDSNLAIALWQLGRREEARQHLVRAESGYRALQPDGAEGLGLVLSSLAWMEYIDRDLEPSESHLNEALELQSARLGPDHPIVAELLGKLALVLHARGASAEARALYERVLAILSASRDSVRELAGAQYAYAVLLFELRAFGEAVPLVEEAILGFASLPFADPLAVGRAELLLARCLSRVGRSAEEAGHLREALRLLESSPRATPGELTMARKALQALEAEVGDAEHGVAIESG